MAKITEKYQSLKTKYNLPEFSDMNRAYDIEGIDAESSQVLAKIRNQMKEQIESYAKALEGFIQPDSSLGAMYETHFMSDETRKESVGAHLHGSTGVFVCE